MRTAFTAIGALLVACNTAPTIVSDAGRDAGILANVPDFGPAPGHDATIGDLAGDHWDGTIEGDAFPSGSHRAQIIFDHASGDGPRTGVVVFGMAAAPPVATDPTVGYPRGFGRRGGGSDAGLMTMTEGFVYPIVNGACSGTHLSVTINGYGLWERWCELQTPVPLGDGESGYGCLPDGAEASFGSSCVYEPVDGPLWQIDCGRMELCHLAYCDCTIDGCVARMQSPITFELDVAGASATGTVTLYPDRGAHLTRM